MRRPVLRQPAHRRRPNWLAVGLLSALAFGLLSCAALALGVGILYADGILPGVYSGGMALGGLSRQEAAAALQAGWTMIRLRDGERVWRVPTAELGITLDAEATARAAYEVGRSNVAAAPGAILTRVLLPPVVQVDLAAAEQALVAFAPQVEQWAINAGMRLVDGLVQTMPPADGRALDIAATLAPLAQDAGAVLADGLLELALVSTRPAVTDASPLVEQAERLLSNFLDIRVFDPVTGDSVYWSLPPTEWGAWLAAEPDASSPLGLALAADPVQVRDYLARQASAALDAGRYLDLDAATAAVQQTLRAGRTETTVRVFHHDRQHVVQPGETIISIAWDYGVPYPWIQQANGGVDRAAVGQTLVVPSPDKFLLYPPVPDKRIIVSISRQRAWIYEGGAIKWEWPVSTGIASSPTWPGVYQIISHVPNAYAANWDLWMPNFLGVYQPIPGADFTNGFHGFPTRGSSQLLWTNSLGTRVTYGCILLSNDNSRLLYEWAQEGVVVEIQA